MCDCCGKKDVFVVCSSAFGPISWAYCEECYRKPAEPESGFEFLYGLSGGDGLIEDVKSFFTFKDGAYVSWEDWLAWRRSQPRRDLEWRDGDVEHHDD